MSLENIHVGDYGYQIELTIVQDGVAVPISDYTTRQYIFVAPSGAVTPQDVGFATNGEDGKLTYTVAEGDIDEAGHWLVFARVAKEGAELTSRYHRFGVARRLDPEEEEV